MIEHPSQLLAQTRAKPTTDSANHNLENCTMKPRYPIPEGEGSAVFSLVCLECDAGMEIKTRLQATTEGWTEIEYAPDLPMANFIGLCPDCLADAKREDAEQ
jgi:hypothetical protein